MKKSILILIGMAGIMGCELQDPLDVGDRCMNMQFIALEQEQHCRRGECPVYEAYFKANYCPHEYPLCRTDNNNDAYCHVKCGGGLIVCNEVCVDPKSSDFHCGAKGMCNSDNPESDHYTGLKCDSGYKCTTDDAGSRCELECDDSKVKCMLDDGTYDCIDPRTDNRFCGARGLCKDYETESEHFKGQVCRHDEVCMRQVDTDWYACELTCNAGFVKCKDSSGNERCVDPKYDTDFCGARGDCTDKDPESMNFRGYACVDTQSCRADDSGDYGCTCVNGFVLCDTGEVKQCVDPKSDDYCGASGTCDDASADSENFKGQKCVGGQLCAENEETGKRSCVCPEGQIFCAGKCIMPNVEHDYCGARGACTNKKDFKDENYAGKKCKAAEMCIGDENAQYYYCEVCDSASGNYVYCDENNKCIDLTNNKNHCGKCSQACETLPKFDKEASPSSRCENSECCHIGEFHEDVGLPIKCCSGTKLYKFSYGNWFSCTEHTHYGCYEADPGKCWSEVD